MIENFEDNFLQFVRVGIASSLVVFRMLVARVADPLLSIKKYPWLSIRSQAASQKQKIPLCFFFVPPLAGK